MALSFPVSLAGRAHERNVELFVPIADIGGRHGVGELFDLSVNEVSGSWGLQIEILLKASN